MIDKNKRKRDILLVAVEEYIKSAQPITSLSLNTVFKDISSATIRNELNALESMGYLKQLHTSGGRVPTNLAYKEYVQNLLTSKEFNYKDINKVIEDYDEKSVSLISTLSTFAKRLSKVTNCPTVLVKHGLQNLVVENVQIVPLIKKDALLLIETSAGIIDDNLPLDDNIERATCIEASDYLTKYFKGKTIQYMLDNIKSVCFKAGSQILNFREVINSVANALIDIIKTKCDISNENPTKMLSALKTNEYDEAKNVFEFLEDKDNIVDIIDKEASEVSYTLGDNNKLKDGMMLTAPIRINGVPIASLALVGPKRIDYGLVAAALKFIVKQIDNKGGKSE